MAQCLIFPSGKSYPLKEIPYQTSLYSLGFSKTSSPFLIRALSVLKPCFGFFLERKEGFPTFRFVFLEPFFLFLEPFFLGFLLLKKADHAFAKSLIANYSTREDKEYCQSALSATNKFRTTRFEGDGNRCNSSCSSSEKTILLSLIANCDFFRRSTGTISTR